DFYSRFWPRLFANYELPIAPYRGTTGSSAETAIARDILNREVASPPFGQFPALPVNAMISVSNVSMRYGAKVLFDEVSTAFTPGKRYGLNGPYGAGKST